MPSKKNNATLNATSHVQNLTHGARSVSDERAGASYERPFVKSISQKKLFFGRNRLGDLKRLLSSCSYSRSYKVRPRTPHDKCPSGCFNLANEFFSFIWRMITQPLRRSHQNRTKSKSKNHRTSFFKTFLCAENHRFSFFLEIRRVGRLRILPQCKHDCD